MMQTVLRKSLPLPRLPSFVGRRRRRSEVVVVESGPLESSPSSSSLQSSASSRSLGSSSGGLKRRRSRRKIMDECTETGNAVPFSNPTEDAKVVFQEPSEVIMHCPDEPPVSMDVPPTTEVARASTAGTVMTNGSIFMARKQVSFSKSEEYPTPRRLDRSSSLRRSDERHIFCLSDQETLQALRTTILTEAQTSSADRAESACMRGLELLKTPEHFDRRHDLKNMVIKSVLKLQRHQRHLSQKDLQERMAKASLIGSEWARRFGLAIASSDEDYVNIVVYKKALVTEYAPHRWSSTSRGHMFASTSVIESGRRSERQIFASTSSPTNKQNGNKVASTRRHSSGSIAASQPRRDLRTRRWSNLLTKKT